LTINELIDRSEITNKRIIRKERNSFMRRDIEIGGYKDLGILRKEWFI
jgi:hypothetical protein